MTMIQIGKGLELDVNVEALPALALEHVIKIGLRNVLMDAHAGINSKAMPELSGEQVREQSLAVSTKKLAALMAGEVRTVGARGPRDGLGAEVARLAKLAVTAAIKAKGWKMSDPKVKAGFDVLVQAYTLKHAEQLNADAKANLAATAQVAGDVDLESIGL